MIMKWTWTSGSTSRLLEQLAKILANCSTSAKRYPAPRRRSRLPIAECEREGQDGARPDETRRARWNRGEAGGGTRPVLANNRDAATVRAPRPRPKRLPGGGSHPTPL